MTTIRDNPDKSRWEISDADTLAGFLEYRRNQGVIDFLHTETLPGHEGRGLAKQLVTAALAAARADGLAVLPHCPYVRKVIADNPASYLDLVPLEARTEFNLPSS